MAPRLEKDLHRPLSVQDELDISFTCRMDRGLQDPDAAVQPDLFILEHNSVAAALLGRSVAVMELSDCRLGIRRKGLPLAWRAFDHVRRVDQGVILENKRLSAAFELCRGVAAG